MKVCQKKRFVVSEISAKTILIPHGHKIIFDGEVIAGPNNPLYEKGERMHYVIMEFNTDKKKVRYQYL